MITRRGFVSTSALAALPVRSKRKRLPSRETLAQVTPSNSVLIVGAQGELMVYSPAEGANNLQQTISAYDGAHLVSFTDQYGNAVLSGTVSYQFSPAAGLYVATRVLGPTIAFYSAATQAGPWVQTALIGAASGSAVAGLTVELADVAPFYVTGGPVRLGGQGAPSKPPASTGDLYVDLSGRLHYLGPGGTDTVLAGP